jgi:hypothetical protein
MQDSDCACVAYKDIWEAFVAERRFIRTATAQLNTLIPNPRLQHFPRNLSATAMSFIRPLVNHFSSCLCATHYSSSTMDG